MKSASLSLLARLRRWLTFQEVCAWCVPTRRVSGAPWAETVSHVMCPACEVRVRAEILAKVHQKLELDSLNLITAAALNNSGAQRRPTKAGEDHERRASAAAPVSWGCE